MGYGLYQGLNESYDAFRGRERDIEAQSDREADRISREETARRSTEEYEYGLSRRPMQEEAEGLALEEARRSGERGVQDTAEHLSPEAIASRATKMKQENELLSQQLQASGIKLDQTEMDSKAAISRRKYQEWSESWSDGSMTVDDLVEAFNTDDIQGNNIAEGGVKAVGEGWEITMENGVVQKFADRRAVTQHLQESSSPEFLQTMLLNEYKSKADLAVAMKKSDTDASTELNKRGNAWIGNTDKEMKSAMGKVFPGGITSFGEEGDAELASGIRAMTNRIGRAYGYDVGRITPSEVATEIGIIAAEIMDTDPAARTARAAEIIDNKGDQEFEDPVMFPNGKPDPGDPEYDSLMKNLIMQQARGDMEALEREVYSRFARINGLTGALEGKDNRKTGEKKTESAIPVPERADASTSDVSTSGVVQPDDVTATEVAAANENIPPKGLEPRKTGPGGGMTSGPNISDQAAQFMESQKANMEAARTKKQRDKAKRQYGLDRAKVIGVNSRANWKAADKAKIKSDYDQNFEALTQMEKEAWFQTFGRGLNKDTKKLARAMIEGRTAVAER